MVPFLQNACNLRELHLNGNNLQSEGFNLLFRALSNAPLEKLICNYCCIGSIEIDSENIPRKLQSLSLNGNHINADGCRELTKLLQGGDSTLTNLYLNDNKIDDDRVGILVDALQNNTSLESLGLQVNNGISEQGQIMLLKLVSNISSIDATLQSNHTLNCIYLKDDEIGQHISEALSINRGWIDAGKDKIIDFQLHSGRRAELAELQGVSHSVYSEINPLHLPEVFALISKNHGQGELYVALKSSIAGVISTVNREQCLQRPEYRAKMEAVEAEFASINGAEGDLGSASESRSNKRRRT